MNQAIINEKIEVECLITYGPGDSCSRDTMIEKPLLKEVVENLSPRSCLSTDGVIPVGAISHVVEL